MPFEREGLAPLLFSRVTMMGLLLEVGVTMGLEIHGTRLRGPSHRLITASGRLHQPRNGGKGQILEKNIIFVQNTVKININKDFL